jgi:ABC-type nitrate/sulfonate/bicarbonate transport system substrate-binding protein/lysophospholipase L1-like esterase
MKKKVIAILLILGSNALILFTAHLMRQSVVDSWKKGPLIDPAAPYAPENAQWYFAIGMCCIVNLYFVLLFVGKKWRNQFWYPALALLFSIVLTEIGISQYLNTNQSTYFKPHPTLHWMCRPNLENFENRTGGGIINTNQHGMREVQEEYEKPENQFRILVLGDSSNFGHGVSGQEMWSSQLQKILDPVTSRDVRVLNGACPGWTTWQGVEVAQTYGQRYQPDIIIAGFNNDAGPDFFTDRERVPNSSVVRFLNGILFHSELYLLSREAVLSIARKFSPTAKEAYSIRLAGKKSKYGKLNEKEAKKLKSRVPLKELEENLRTLQRLSKDNDGEFIWVNMPINRREGEFVERYVRWDYRQRIEQLVAEEEISFVDVDDYWMRTREDNLHIPGHVFHPNATGHRRMAELIAQEVLRSGILPELDSQIQIKGPPAAKGNDVLRLGWSSKTPVHSHIGLVLSQHPELSEKYGIELELHQYESGKEQGKDLAEGKLDAWFSCEVPAIHMLASRPDARIIASPGYLGRIAVVSNGSVVSLQDLKGKVVGLSKGSTPDMVWRNYWLKEIGASRVVDVSTLDLENALLTGTVDAVVSWDPWVEQWVEKHQGWTILAERSFRSVLIVGKLWALGGSSDDPRAKRLVQMLEEVLEIASKERGELDKQAAKLGGWSFATVQKVANQNNQLLGKQKDIALTKEDRVHIRESMRFVDGKRKHVEMLFGEYLLDGELPKEGKR